MVRVTDCNYYLDPKVKQKLDVMIKRIEQPQPAKDAVLIMEGAEGEGKSNSSIACAYYVKSETQRPIHLFFRLEALLKFAVETDKQIIIYDEPALDALSTDWYKDTNKNLMRLLMTARKKRHFIFFNFTKFFKFSEYIVVDRALGLVHMYSRNEITPGRFVYIKKKNLEKLYIGYRTSKKRLYKKLASFRGSFSEVMNKHFDKMDITIETKEHCKLEDYEHYKDEAIKSITDPKETKKAMSPDKLELKKLKKKVGSIKPYKNNITSLPQLAELLGVSVQTLDNWEKGVFEEEEVKKEGQNELLATNSLGNSGL